MTEALPGSVIGIVGGGQLGRMTAQAAATLGYKTHIFSPSKGDPAKQVSDFETTAGYDDVPALKEFASSVDIVTFEFENIPHNTLKALEDIAIVRPNAGCLHIAQNRIREKDFINSVAVPTAPYKAINCEEDLQGAMEKVGTNKAILKTSEFGYDGKGQAVVSSEEELHSAWHGTPSVLEGFVPFDIEVSAIIARGQSGESVCFPIGENVHKDGILDVTMVPASINDNTKKQAEEFAKKIADELDLVGLLAVEFFVLPDGSLVVNEIAPRPHNSGHWSMDGCKTSQFEQFVRAICGLDFGNMDLLGKSTMKNLLGEDINTQEAILEADPEAIIHTYGKEEVRAGRKMGHVNYVEK